MPKIVRFAIDFEAAGPDFSRHAALSVGVCVVPRIPMSIPDLMRKGYLFYAELPAGNKLAFELEAARIGMSHLECLDALRGTPGLGMYDHRSDTFNPAAVLAHMNSVLPPLSETVRALRGFVKRYADSAPIEAVVDTAFFDSVLMQQLAPALFGYRGLDLASCYRGLTGSYEARLSDVLSKDERRQPHHAGEDACGLAQIAQKVLYETLKWK